MEKPGVIEDDLPKLGEPQQTQAPKPGPSLKKIHPKSPPHLRWERSQTLPTHHKKPRPKQFGRESPETLNKCEPRIKITLQKSSEPIRKNLMLHVGSAMKFCVWMMKTP
jgi:hypothetical protein